MLGVAITAALPTLEPMVEFELRTVADTAVPDHLVASLTSLLTRLVGQGAALGWTEPPSEADVTDLLAALTTAPEGDACLVIALDGDDLAGFGYWRRYQLPTNRPHADIEKLAVDPACAASGLGRNLLRRLIDEARTSRVEQLTLEFRGDNHVAERLYLSEGFREYGRLADFVAPGDGRRFDKVFHVLDLRDEAATRRA